MLHMLPLRVARHISHNQTIVVSTLLVMLNPRWNVSCNYWMVCHWSPNTTGCRYALRAVWNQEKNKKRVNVYRWFWCWHLVSTCIESFGICVLNADLIRVKSNNFNERLCLRQVAPDANRRWNLCTEDSGKVLLFVEYIPGMKSSLPPYAPMWGWKSCWLITSFRQVVGKTSNFSLD